MEPAIDRSVDPGMKFGVYVAAAIFGLFLPLALPSPTADATELKTDYADAPEITLEKTKSDDGELRVTQIADDPNSLRFYVDDRLVSWESDGSYRRGVVPIALALSSRARDTLGSVAVVGFSTDSVAYAAKRYGAGSIEIVESDRALGRAVRKFSLVRAELSTGSSITSYYHDPRQWLKERPARYDMVLIEARAIKFDRAMFDLAARALDDDGFAALWVPLGAFSAPELERLIARFGSVFKTRTLWFSNIDPERSSLLLLGSNAPHFSIDPVKLERNIERAQEALVERRNVYSFLSFYISDGSNVSDTSKSSPIEYKYPLDQSGVERSRENFKWLVRARRKVDSILSPLSKADRLKLDRYFQARSFIIEAREKVAETKLVKDELEAYDKALALDVADSYLAQGYFMIGAAYYRSNLLMFAKPALEKAKKVTPRNAATRHMLGLTYEKMLDHKRANEEFKATRELDPGYERKNLRLDLSRSLNYCPIGKGDEDITKLGAPPPPR